MADTPTKPGRVDPLASEHLTRPTEPDGIGPTLGEDVSPENERREDEKSAAFRKSQQQR
jgi:hypothetical protein